MKRQQPQTLPPAAAAHLPLLLISLLSGFYLLTLETVIIRLLGLVAGPSPNHFTLTVAIFIFGLGFGSLLVRRIGFYRPSRLLMNQSAAFIGLLFVYLTVDAWSYGVHWLRVQVNAIHESYALYESALGLALSVLLLPPLGFCGITLPLCFHLWKNRQQDLGDDVGRLYGVNSLGTVCGALLGGYALLTVLNLDHLYKLCLCAIVATTAAAGVLCLGQRERRPAVVSGSVVVASVAIVVVWMCPPFAKERFFSPFQQRNFLPGASAGIGAFTAHISQSQELLHHEDGPNSSVAIVSYRPQGNELGRSLYMSGKGDGNTRTDFFTFIMLGHIPAVLAERLDRAAVIGLGTGITAGALALYEGIEAVDVAEISGTLIDNARLFDDYNGGISSHPRVHFYGMDAFRFLVGTEETYDVIVSMPSNPWVTGVENLFSSEFYALAEKKLRDGGLYAQWLQSYSSTPEILRMVLRTMGRHFPYVTVFQLQRGDLLLLGGRRPLGLADLDRAARRLEDNRKVRSSLQVAGVRRLETILALEMMPPSLAKEFGREGKEHHLELPRLSRAAMQAYFDRQAVNVDAVRRLQEDYLASVDEALLGLISRRTPTPDLADILRNSFCEHPVGRSVEPALCREALARSLLARPDFELTDEQAELLADEESALRLLGNGLPAQLSDVTIDQFDSVFRVIVELHSPVARMPLESIAAYLERCLADMPKTSTTHRSCLQKKRTFQDLLGRADS
jgi:spermidine synthase